MQQIISMTKPIEISYTNPPAPIDILVRIAKFYDAKMKVFMRAPLLFYVPPEFAVGMYVGDVILTINGTPSMQQTVEELQQYVVHAQREI